MEFSSITLPTHVKSWLDWLPNDADERAKWRRKSRKADPGLSRLLRDEQPGETLDTNLAMKGWVDTGDTMEELSISCMLADTREALLPIRGRENLVPKKRDRTLDSGLGCDEAYLSSSGGSPCAGAGQLTREERRRRRRATLKYRTAHATRERIRVEAFNAAFASLRRLLPTLPPDKKLSKIEILRLAICYIAYLNHVLDA